MIDLTLKLFDKLIELARAGHQRDRDWYNDFLRPLEECFENVHQHYLDTFRKCRTCLSECPPRELDIVTSRIQEQIKTDVLFYSGEAAKFWNLTIEVYHAKASRRGEMLCRLAEDLAHYLDRRLDEDHLSRNVKRTRLVDLIGKKVGERVSWFEERGGLTLRREAEEDRRRQLLNLIDHEVMILQLNYNRITQAFLELKKHYLTK